MVTMSARNVTKKVTPPEGASADSAPKKRRALADGPAFREAMAELEGESSSGWKVLEGPTKPTATSGERAAIVPRPVATVPRASATSADPKNPKPPTPPPAPRRDLNRTQLGLAPPAPARQAAPPAVAPPAVEPPPKAEADAFASSIMAAIAETAPRSPQPSAPVVLEEETLVAEPAPVVAPAPVPELAKLAELATVVPPPDVTPPPGVPPPPPMALAPVATPPPYVPPPPLLQEPPAPMAPAPVFAVSPERVGAASAMMTMPIEPLRAAPPPSRRRWVVGLVIGGAIGGLVVALGVLALFMRNRTAQHDSGAHAAATTKTTGAPPPAAAAPPADPAPAPASATPSAPDPSPAPEQPSGSAGHDAIPWADQPQTSSGDCKEAAAAVPGSVSVDAAIQNALRAMMRGDPKAAHESFCSATERGAQNQTVLMGHARALLIQSDYAAALQVVDRELQLRPSPAARLLRGDVLIRMGNVEEAKQAWLSAAGVPPDSDPLVQNLWRGYKAEAQGAIRAGDLARADRTLRRVIALGPPERQLCLQLADTLDKRGESAAAERWRAYASTLDG
jgi:Flp pilus assembly protein TadD